jgi:hypothetical protein
MPRISSGGAADAGQAVTIEQLKAIIGRIPPNITGGLGSVVRAGLAPYAKEMKRQLGSVRRSGFLGKSIKSRVVSYPNGTTYGIVGPARDVVGDYHGKRVVPANYSHLVEFGTKPHAIGKGSYLKREGRSRPQTQVGRVHPGAKPHPYRAVALAAAAGQSRRDAAAKANQILKDAVASAIG